MSRKDQYWAEKDDIEKEANARTAHLLVRHKGLQGGISNPDEYEKAKVRETILLNDNLKDLNNRFGVEPRKQGEDGKTMIERINKTLEGNGGEQNEQ